MQLSVKNSIHLAGKLDMLNVNVGHDLFFSEDINYLSCFPIGFYDTIPLGFNIITL